MAKADQNLFLKEDFLLNEELCSLDLEISPRETFIVFDWDDTILPTSWLVKNKISLETPFIPPQRMAELEELDSVACNLLRRAAFLYGQVLIITNAQQGWVELASKKFLPETHELIFSSDTDSDMSSQHSYSSSSSDFRRNDPRIGEKRTWEGNSKTMAEDDEKNESTNQLSGKIQVFSARHLFEKENPLDPSAWKKHAFQKLLRSRISSQFFRSKTKIQSAEPVKRIKSMSVAEMECEIVPEETPQKLKLERRNSDLSGLDLSDLVELEGESYEIEEDLCDRASFFSVDFSVDPNEKILDEFEFESFPDFHPSTKPEIVTKRPCCNLISIGDCFHDRDSLRDLELDLKDTVKKTVKLMEFPTISQLQAQLVSIDNYLNRIIYLAKDVDLEVNRKLFIS